MKKLKIAIIGHMPSKGYSGGRYCAWIMAEALAHQGNEVYVITNNIPEFRDDFKDNPHHDRIRIILTGDFYDIPEKIDKLNYVICIPTLGQEKLFYYACLDLSIRTNAGFAFINFETPNWFKKYAQMGRPEEDYKCLKKMCKYGCLVFSLAQESQKYAETYYNLYEKSTEFEVWSPPINSVVADAINVKRENQIIAFIRLKDKYKGGDDIFELLGEPFRGTRLVLVVGNGEVSDEYQEEIERKAKQYAIEIVIKKKLSDEEKFTEIKKSKILLFPSRFEGYGYPPVEALYCGTKCVAYDLPVLREISGDALEYCEAGNFSEMAEKASVLLKATEFSEVCVDTAEFAKQAQRLQCLLENNLTNPKLYWNHTCFGKVCNELRKWYYTKIKSRTGKKILPEMIKYCIDHKVVISKKLNPEDETLKRLKELSRNKEVYIWGCGKAYRDVFPKYAKNIKIAGLLDSNPDKAGHFDSLCKKIRIQSPKILEDAKKDNVVVLISNKEYVDEIIEKLEEMNIKNYHSLCMIALNSTASKLYRLIKKGKKDEK